MNRIRLAAFALVLGLAAPAAAEDSHVRARLVSDLEALTAGATFHVGVVLEPEPGWHVYWRNPGGAGLATEVELELPDGYAVGGLRWPAPVVFAQPGGIVGYGYEEAVLLAAEVAAPPGAAAPVPVRAAASWLACKDVCVLGSAELEAELPLTGEAAASARTAFAGWADTLPRAAARDEVAVSVTGGPLPGSGAAALAVWLSWPEPPGGVEVFPDPGPGLKVEDVRTRSRGALTRVDLTAARLQGSSAPAATLPVVVVRTDAEGGRTALELDIDLD
ncbi:MAG TPA: protein-disulfide reductase DsbD domain-containing protein [Candidatus Sulfomarinibacteraceae bacterium]|nr:protein-disulfide reductase DsbD domain-containing protein [Candidatus Sulfomarinibacteraceae bacterium]